MISILRFKNLVFEEIEKNNNLDIYSLYYLRLFLVKPIVGITMIIQTRIVFDFENNSQILFDLHKDYLEITSSIPKNGLVTKTNRCAHTQVEIFNFIRNIIRRINTEDTIEMMKVSL